MSDFRDDSGQPPRRPRPGHVRRPSAGGRRRTRSRRSGSPPPDSGPSAAVPPHDGAADGAPGGTAVLWRLRATVRDEPGALAALCTALARHGVDIRSLQVLPLETSPSGAARCGELTVDELLVRAPGRLGAGDLARAVRDAGGTAVWTERADPHDLVDAPARALALAARTVPDPAELPPALRQLLGRCTVRSVPSPAGAAVPAGGLLSLREMRLPDSSGGVLVIERAGPEFTPAEFARARALVELDARLRLRAPEDGDPVPPGGAPDLGFREAGVQDLPAALDLHRRCSPQTLRMRYHGPVADADSYLPHLLSPHFGRTLAVETPARRLVALGHLLWDGEETEVAVLVEDAWQRRGIGRELVRRLVRTAARDGYTRVYAVVRGTNTGMLAAMRALGLPLDHQAEEGTAVVTARLGRETVPAAAEPPAGPVPGPGPAGRR